MHGHSSTGLPNEEPGCWDGYRAVTAEGGIRAAVSIETENREVKISGSRRENFPVRLNGHGKRGAGITTSKSNHHLTAGAETRIERPIAGVTQEARLFGVLHSRDRSGYHDLAVTLYG